MFGYGNWVIEIEYEDGSKKKLDKKFLFKRNAEMIVPLLEIFCFEKNRFLIARVVKKE